jgi:hypothetical protein
MRGAAAYGAVKIKVGACDIEAMSPPMLLMARGGVTNPPLSDLVADFAGASIKTFLRQRRADLTMLRKKVLEIGNVAASFGQSRTSQPCGGFAEE